MRAIALLCLPALMACDRLGDRTPIDSLVSFAVGRDCSLVHVDLGRSYCTPLNPWPGPQPFCTRSRGAVDCWTRPPPAIPPYVGLANGFPPPTPAQADWQTRWQMGVPGQLVPPPPPEGLVPPRLPAIAGGPG